VTTREAAPEIIEPVPESCTAAELGDYAQRERIAANAGEVLTEQVGGSAVIASDSRADDFDVMAFPAHLAKPDDARGRSGEESEIGDGEPESRVGRDRATKCRYRVGHFHGLLRLTVEGGGLDVCRNHPTVVLDRGTSGGGPLGTAGVGPLQVAVHDYQVGLVT
jgi:hypothetical protein